MSGSQRTPNVPKSRDSFFHRKYRDISNCPPTPATPKVTASSYHQHRSATASSKLSSSSLNTPTSTSSKKSKKLKRDQNQSITSDYSTPRTIRTPSSGRSRGKQRITHLKYMPLELDTESSSESFENNYRRRKLTSTTPRSAPVALAIEEPMRCSPIMQNKTPNPMTNELADDVDSIVNKNGSPMVDNSTSEQAVAKTKTYNQTTNICIRSSDTGDKKTPVEPPLVKETLDNSMNTDEVQVIAIYRPAPATGPSNQQVVGTNTKTITISTCSSNNNNDASSTVPNIGTESVVSSEPPTPPITPEKVKEETSTFKPGNIWIFKPSQERNSVLSTQTT